MHEYYVACVIYHDKSHLLSGVGLSFELFPGHVASDEHSAFRTSDLFQKREDTDCFRGAALRRYVGKLKLN
jgi:hypothetical protein